MKKYNWNKVEMYIDKYKDQGLKSADLGMREDWWWTAEEVWNSEDGFLDNFKGEIGGIIGSTWATPSIMLHFEEEEKMFPCHDDGESIPKPAGVGPMGVLSVPAQERLPQLEEDEFNQVGE